jgi:hypothetical protein
MDWEDILKYDRIIIAIAAKYTGSDLDLREDIAQSVRLALFEDRRLDTNKFDPKKKDAAIRNTIRNKTIKVLRSKKLGRWPHASLEGLAEMGLQVDSEGNVVYPDVPGLGPPVDTAEGEEA